MKIKISFGNFRTMPSAVGNRTYRAWGKYRITEVSSETSSKNSGSIAQFLNMNHLNFALMKRGLKDCLFS